MNRRKFLAIMGSAGVISALGTAKVANAGVHTFPYYADSYGVLHDTTRCSHRSLTAHRQCHNTRASTPCADVSRSAWCNRG